MAGGINNHQKFNLLNITNIGKPGSEGQMKVPVSDVGRDLVIKIFDLTTPTSAAAGSESRLTMALKTLVEQSGVSIDYDRCSTEGDVLKAIGKHIEEKQVKEGGGAPQQLTTQEKTLLQNLEIVMKAARKLMSIDSRVKFECFGQFKRETRYEYDGNEYKGERTTSKSGTAWTSYFKDALAFDSIKFGGSKNVANAMTSVGNDPSQTLSNEDHATLLSDFSARASTRHRVSIGPVKSSEIAELKNKQADKLKEIDRATSHPASSERASSRPSSTPTSIAAPVAPEDNTVSGFPVLLHQAGLGLGLLLV